MSQENVEIVRRLVERWNRGERSGLDDAIHPEIEIVSRFRPDPYRRRDGFEQWLREIDEQFEEWQIAVDEWRNEADRVVALGQLHIRGRIGGIDLDPPAAAVVGLADNKVVRLQLFGDHAQALEAAGLRT
jgi:ketosteroid isomerase-like protein